MSDFDFDVTCGFCFRYFGAGISATQSTDCACSYTRGVVTGHYGSTRHDLEKLVVSPRLRDSLPQSLDPVCDDCVDAWVASGDACVMGSGLEDETGSLLAIDLRRVTAGDELVHSSIITSHEHESTWATERLRCDDEVHVDNLTQEEGQVTCMRCVLRGTWPEWLSGWRR